MYWSGFIVEAGEGKVVSHPCQHSCAWPEYLARRRITSVTDEPLTRLWKRSAGHSGADSERPGVQDLPYYLESVDHLATEYKPPIGSENFSRNAEGFCIFGSTLHHSDGTRGSKPRSAVIVTLP